MKNKVAIGIIIISLSTFIVRQQFAYPSVWDRIHIGMSRQEVNALIGPGEGEIPYWKGQSWRDSGIIIWHVLHLHIEGDRVTAVWIDRYWGEHHPMGVVRSEASNTQEH